MLPTVFLALCIGRAAAAAAGSVACDLLSDGIDVLDGVRLIRSPGNHTGRSDSVASALADVIGRYDIRVKLRRLLPPGDVVPSGLRTALSFLSADNEPRGPTGMKKGNGILMAATMMGGTMAALGFGALGMLTMKALTVSAMALALSVIMGLKKLFSKTEHESGHIVSYVPVHHAARKKRTPYFLHDASIS